MFCPNCGANNNTEQKFCRACGLNLEETAGSLIAQLPSAGEKSLLKQRQQLEKLGTLAFCGFSCVVVIGIIAIIYAIFTRFIFNGPPDSVITGILLILFIIFAALALAYVVFNEILKEKKQKINPHAGTEMGGAKDTGKLLHEGALQPVSSVTDHTTELLYDKSRTKKLD